MCVICPALLCVRGKRQNKRAGARIEKEGEREAGLVFVCDALIF